MKKILLLLFVLIAFIGCKSCSPQKDNKTPYIREEPGKEFCPNFCDKMVELNCSEYLLENNDVDFCNEWCVHSQENSIQLNPECMAKVSKCDQVDCASRISPDKCINIDEICTP